MRTLLLFLLLPFFCTSQDTAKIFYKPAKTIQVFIPTDYTLPEFDTLPAILKLQQGNYTSYVKGKVVLTKDCRVVEYLRVNTWKRKERIRKFKKKVVDYRLINN